MPRRDGTGPDGNGAGTGRRLGPCCAGQTSERRGLGRRGSRGFSGFRNNCRWNKYNTLNTIEN